MTGALEKIWLEVRNGERLCVWDYDNGTTEYTRSDLISALLTQARAEGIREAAEIEFEADDCYLARNGILALLDTDALTPPQEGRTNE